MIVRGAGTLLLTSVVGVLLATSAQADVASIVASKDNTIFSEFTTNSNGAGIHIFSGRTNLGQNRRALIAFDFAGAVPSGSTITQVTLTLNESKVSSTATGPVTMTLHKITADWGEGTSNAGNLNDGSGTAAATGDATWVNRFYNTATWATPGGDFVATASGSASVGTTLGPYTWVSTLQMVADVQDWLNNPAGNFGWLLKGDETAGATARQFDSSEFSIASSRPTLSVTFTPPAAGVVDWILY